ncbi:MAG TPA: hypothetical protein VN253_00890 [Kofleriaceae bacterium]|nr:hypothetical protein [Kofleriaceae bacterium]
MRRALVLVLALGCGGKDKVVPADAEPDAAPDAPPDALVVPVFRNPVNLPDDQLALSALRILGANVPGASTTSCNGCHNLTRQQLRNWRALSDTAMSACLTDLTLSSRESARTMIQCLRAMPDLPQSDFQAKKLGIYASAAHLPWFDVAIDYGYGASTGAMLATELVKTAGMPRSGGAAVPLSQAQFDVVAEWFVRGLPMLEQTLPQDPPPQHCDPSVSAEVAAHVTAMKTQGWRALNKTAMMAMFGCGAATDPKLCLSTVPLGSVQPYGTGWDLPGRGKLRVLADETYRSSYWTRSSPDGRFMGHGVQNVPGSYIVDLQRGGALIPIDVAYDPNWFPDNSGFVFQGGPRNTCGQSVLTSNPTSITMTEPQCTSLTTVGLYEHVGAVSGGDHFAIDSRFVSDDGGHSPTFRDPYASFSSVATISFSPLIYDGTKFTAKPEITISSPFEGDTVLSPSARLIVSRVAGPGDNQLGYVLRKVVADPVAASYAITAPEIARYCVSGGKPGFSYDERWMVYHHYVTPADAVELGFTGPADPGFAAYLAQGAANIYLLDLSTGVSVRITNMHPGQYALFPHFRSDGWIYGVVRDIGAVHEYMVASDAALLAE